MSQYKVVFSKSAAKEVYKLPVVVTNRVIKAIVNLSMDPRPQGSRKLKGSSENWRIRIGDYRIVYAIDDELFIIDIRKVGHRKEIYD